MTNPTANTLEWNLISQPCIHSTHYGWSLFRWTFLAYFDWFQLVQVGDWGIIPYLTKHAKQIHVLLSRKLAMSPWFLVQSRGKYINTKNLIVYRLDSSKLPEIMYDYLRSLSCMALIIEIFICVVTIFQQNTLQIWYYSNQGKNGTEIVFAMTHFHALAKCRSSYLVIHSALHLH